jgi:hypothetical protein
MANLAVAIAKYIPNCLKSFGSTMEKAWNHFDFQAFFIKG